jgi:L-threonylcarbamoyladenylate synthase
VTGADAVARPAIIDLAALDAAAAADLEERISRARLICFPTDTVYGVGGALTPAVGDALVAAKGRDPGKPLQVIFASVGALEAAVAPAPGLRAACRRLLPGPLTLLLPYPAGWDFPPPGTAGETFGRPAVPTLGVRVPAWPAAARVLEGLHRPLVASSANLSGASSPASLSGVDASLLAQCDLALDAGPVSGLASTVVDLSRYAKTGRWRLLRLGAWGEAEVAARLGGGPEGPALRGERTPGD